MAKIRNVKREYFRSRILDVIDHANNINDQTGYPIIDIFYQKFSNEDNYIGLSLTSNIKECPIRRVEFHPYNDDKGYTLLIHDDHDVCTQIDIPYDLKGQRHIINYFYTWCDDINYSQAHSLDANFWYDQISELMKNIRLARNKSTNDVI